MGEYIKNLLLAAEYTLYAECFQPYVLLLFAVEHGVVGSGVGGVAGEWSCCWWWSVGSRVVGGGIVAVVAVCC